MSGNLKRMKHYTRVNSDKVFVLGPGPSALEHKETIRKIKEHQTPIFVFQKSFPYCVEYFDIIPDYWSYYDPSASLPGLRYLAKNPQLNTKILLPSISQDDKASSFRRYCPADGSTALEKHPEQWEEYRTLIKEVRKHHQCIDVNSDTIFRIHKEESELYSAINGNLSHPKRSQQVIFGTSINFKLKNVGAENKFSLAVLPLVRFLGFKEIYTLGFDGLPGRFYQEKEPDDSRTKSYVSEYRYLNYWISSSEKTGIKIYTVNPYCNIRKHGGLQYKSPLGDFR